MKWLALLLLTLAASLPQGGETPIVGPPSITYETVLRVLQLRPASPLLPYAPDIWSASQAANIDVAFALAIWLKESEFGTTGAATSTRNMGNLICEAATPSARSGCSGRWAVYPSWPAAIGDWFAYVNRRYVAQGLTTVETLLPVYAPPSENDTGQYIDQVTGWMREWGSGTVGTAPPGGGGLRILEPIMDDWIQRPIDEFKYWFWRGLASLLWGDNQAGLGLSDLLARFQKVLVTQGFVPAIEMIAQGMLGISPAVFTLGLTLFLLLVMLLPAMRLTHWVSGRKVILLMLIVPILFGAGAAGYLFQQLEQLRLDVGTIIYNGVFASGTTYFGDLTPPSSGTGRPLSMCPVVPFNPAVSTALHADSVTAAYLCADYEDVTDPDVAPPADLPDAFATTFFELDTPAFLDGSQAQRDEQIAKAAAGVGRMAYGHVLVLMALVESVTNLLWTLGLGIVFISLLFVLIFSWFRPYEHLTTVLATRLLQVLTTSWITTAIFGLVMAALLKVASGMYAPLVLGGGAGVLLLSLVFLWIAGKTVFGAFGAAWDAMSGGNGEAASGAGAFAAGTLMGGGYAGGRMLRRLGHDLRNAPSPVTGIRNLAQARMSYTMASDAGNSSDYAMGYAMSQFRPLAQLGTLATAMGKMSPEFAHGMRTAHQYTRGPGDLLNPTAQHMVRRDGGNAQALRQYMARKRAARATTRLPSAAASGGGSSGASSSGGVPSGGAPSGGVSGGTPTVRLAQHPINTAATVRLHPATTVRLTPTAPAATPPPTPSGPSAATPPPSASGPSSPAGPASPSGTPPLTPPSSPSSGGSAP